MLVGQVVYCLLRVRCSLPKGYTRVVYSGSGPDRIGSCADVGRTCSAERVRRASPGTRPLSQTVQCVLFAFPGTERDKSLHPFDVTMLN